MVGVFASLDRERKECLSGLEIGDLRNEIQDVGRKVHLSKKLEDLAKEFATARPSKAESLDTQMKTAFDQRGER